MREQAGQLIHFWGKQIMGLNMIYCGYLIHLHTLENIQEVAETL